MYGLFYRSNTTLMMLVLGIFSGRSFFDLVICEDVEVARLCLVTNCIHSVRSVRSVRISGFACFRR